MTVCLSLSSTDTELGATGEVKLNFAYIHGLIVFRSNLDNAWCSNFTGYEQVTVG